MASAPSHHIVTNRHVHPDGRMRAWSLRPHRYSIRHAKVSVDELRRRNHRTMPVDVDRLYEDVRRSLQRPDHRNALFFIHGHRLSVPGLRLNLLRHLHSQYVEPEHGPVGVIVFFSWPDRGLPWSEDNEAYEAGRIFQEQAVALLAQV